MLLSTFQKRMRQATITLVIRIRPSVHVEQHNSHRKDFREILYSVCWMKSVGSLCV